jgi:hypothetical protein
MNQDEQLVQLESTVKDIQHRNKRVESDKAWETSILRRVCIFVLTYIVIVVFFYVAALPRPLLNAIVPSLAFVLSTLTLGWVKQWWLSKRD